MVGIEDSTHPTFALFFLNFTMSTRLDQLTKLHAVDPADPFLTYGIALEHIKVHDPKTGLIWLDKTLALDANYFYAYFQKAKALSELDREDEAKQVLTVGMAAAKKAGDGHALSEMQGLFESM